MTETDIIKQGDFVFINGGGGKRIAEVKQGMCLRFGRSGMACTDSLVGMRYGEVVRLDHAAHKFVACDAYPDLDVSDVQDAEVAAVQEKDNRNLIDNNKSQLLSNEAIAAIRKDKGVDALLSELVENSTTFHTKTTFSKEKYLKKKQKKYGTLFKVERVTGDNMAEVHLPTINPCDDQPEEARAPRLRADTVALILHHSDVHDGSRALVYDRTNGLLGAYLLTRLGDSGRLFQVLDKTSQPNTFPARQMGLPNIKERWAAVPRNPGFLLGVEEPLREEKEKEKDEGEQQQQRRVRLPQDGPSQWMKGREAREALLAQPADSLIIVDDESPDRPLTELLPFLANGGHIVVHSPFLEDLTSLFSKLRNDCVNIRISETWYRHQQVLPQRTHPTVNMSTAAGYLLTAVKVESNSSPRTRFVPAASLTASSSTAAAPAEKRPREQYSNAEAKEDTDAPAPKEAKADET